MNVARWSVLFVLASSGCAVFSRLPPPEQAAQVAAGTLPGTLVDVVHHAEATGACQPVASPSVAVQASTAAGIDRLCGAGPRVAVHEGDDPFIVRGLVHFEQKEPGLVAVSVTRIETRGKQDKTPHDEVERKLFIADGNEPGPWTEDCGPKACRVEALEILHGLAAHDG